MKEGEVKMKEKSRKRRKGSIDLRIEAHVSKSK